MVSNGLKTNKKELQTRGVKTQLREWCGERGKNNEGWEKKANTGCFERNRQQTKPEVWKYET